MQQRQLGPFTVSAIGLGCMNLSHAYGTPPTAEVGEALIYKALDIGVTLLIQRRFMVLGPMKN